VYLRLFVYVCKEKEKEEKITTYAVADGRDTVRRMRETETDRVCGKYKLRYQNIVPTYKSHFLRCDSASLIHVSRNVSG